MRLVLAFTAALAMAWPAGPVTAQEACFCMRHKDGAKLRGCTSFKAPQDFYATAACTDPETGTTAEQMITSEWQRVAEGAEGCTPCRPTRRETDDVPRQPETTEP